MIDAYEMSKIYWRHLKQASVFEVGSLVNTLKSPGAKVYWGEVLKYLTVRRTGKKATL